MTAELAARALQSKPPFLDRYRELADIGVRDVDMPKRLGISSKSLREMLARNGIEASPLLIEIAVEQSERKRRNA